MKQVIYKEIIFIDGREYTVMSCDYSDSIAELIDDGVMDGDDQEIFAHIVDDIVNSQ